MTVWLPTYWLNSLALSLTAAGGLAALYSLLHSVIRLPAGILADMLECGGENVTILGLLIMLNGAVLMTQSPVLRVAVPGIVLMAIGMGLVNEAFFAIVPLLAPRAVGATIGLVGPLGQMGVFIPPIMSLVIRQQSLIDYSEGFIVFATFGTISVIPLSIMVYQKAPAKVEQP